MKIDKVKVKVKEWFENRWENFKYWWKWNYDWFLTLVGVVLFGILFAMFGLYVESEEDRTYDYEIHWGINCHLRCNEEDITREGSTLIIKQDDKTYVLTTYIIEDNRHIK